MFHPGSTSDGPGARNGAVKAKTMETRPKMKDRLGSTKINKTNRRRQPRRRRCRRGASQAAPPPRAALWRAGARARAAPPQLCPAPWRGGATKAHGKYHRLEILRVKARKQGGRSARKVSWGKRGE